MTTKPRRPPSRLSLIAALALVLVMRKVFSLNSLGGFRVAFQERGSGADAGADDSTVRVTGQRANWESAPQAGRTARSVAHARL
jgi:hypothetical protein